MPPCQCRTELDNKKEKNTPTPKTNGTPEARNAESGQCVLSHVGQAALAVLEKEHSCHQGSLWNVTAGRVVGDMHQTPFMAFRGEDGRNDVGEREGHDDWFPDAMADIMKRTQVWCDVLHLAPPDGLFLQKFREAVSFLTARATSNEKPIVVRMLFANMLDFNLKTFVKDLTKDIDVDCQHLRLWVGIWRSHASWNHAKILAVDGQYLHTGGHNLWTDHYLRHNPVHDLSIELNGPVAHDGHLYANFQWDFVEREFDKEFRKMHDCIPLIPMNDIEICRFPPASKDCVNKFPPRYEHPPCKPSHIDTPIISMGCAMLKEIKPSDDAFLAMMLSAKSSIRIVQQDIGPYRIPIKYMDYVAPLSAWPDEILAALGRDIWEKGVVVDIVLSNPRSTPGGLSPYAASYGYGWSCEETAARILSFIRRQFPHAADKTLRRVISKNLRIRHFKQKRGSKWNDGGTMALHSKHFIIDGEATYIGSQNLYRSQLAEWGVLIDSKDSTRKIMEEYWNPIWAASNTDDECRASVVVDMLDKIESSQHDPFVLSDEMWKPILFILQFLFWRPQKSFSRFLAQQLDSSRSSPIWAVLPRTTSGWAALLSTTVSANIVYEVWLQTKLTSPPVVFHQTESDGMMGQICHRMSKSILARDIKPSLFFGTRGLLATTAGFVLKGPSPSEEHVQFRELLTMSQDGATIALDWELPVADEYCPGSPKERKKEVLEGPITKPVVLVLHGICNDTSTGYMRSLSRACVKRGWIAVGMNLRGCGKSPVTTPRGYTGAYTGDLRCVVQIISSRMAKNTELFLVGHSIGANLVVKYLGEEGFSGTLPACVVGGASLANPMTIRAEQWKFPMTQGLSLAARKTMLQSLIQILPMRTPHHRTSLRNALLANTLEDFDRAVAPIAIRNDPVQPFSTRVGYRNVEDYWNDASSFRQIRHISVPLLQVTSRDDFLVHNCSFGKLCYTLSNPNTITVETKCGGHLGWHECPPGDTGKSTFGVLGTSSWSDCAVTEFIESVVCARRDGGNERSKMVAPKLRASL